MKLADIKRGEKHRPPPCEPFLHETLFRPRFHCFTEDLVRERTEVDLILSPLPNLFIFRHQLQGKTTTFGEHWGTYYTLIQKCGLRVQKQVVKEVQMLVQHMGATLVHWISTDALVRWCNAAATLFSSVKDRN